MVNYLRVGEKPQTFGEVNHVKSTAKRVYGKDHNELMNNVYKSNLVPGRYTLSVIESVTRIRCIDYTKDKLHFLPKKTEGGISVVNGFEEYWIKRDRENDMLYVDID